MPSQHSGIFHSRESVIFSVSSFASEGKPETEARSSRSPKELLKKVKVRVRIDLRKCVSDLAPGFCHLVNAFIGFSDGAVEVHSLASCDSVRVDANENNFFL